MVLSTDANYTASYCRIKDRKREHDNITCRAGLAFDAVVISPILQIGQVILNLSRAKLSKSRPLGAFHALEAQQMVCGWSNDAFEEGRSSQKQKRTLECGRGGGIKSIKNTNFDRFTIHFSFNSFLECEQRNVHRIFQL